MALHQSTASVVEKYEEDAAVPCPSANFHLSVWGDFFLAYEAMEPFPEEAIRELEQLAEDIKMMLKKTPDGSSLKLDLIDNIQRLGVSYHFKDEIEASLSNIKSIYHGSVHEETKDDLRVVSLRFRLLRQQGHHVSTEALKKFQNEEGEFEASLASDAHGLLSLYEASHYRVRGENILEEAWRFTTATLKDMLNNNCSEFIAKKINHALNWPKQKSSNRKTARGYISLYQENESHDEVLLKFAKLDFNRVQRLHQKELCALTKWWKGIDCPRNFPFVKDRLVENYFITMMVYFEPEYSLGRMILSKVGNISLIIDDICDTYGTLDELLLFTNAIERWNADAVDQLPQYMKLCCKFLFEVGAEMEEDLAIQGRSEWVHYAKEEVKKYAKSCYEEAYHYHTSYIPTMEELKETRVCSTTANILATISLMGMGDLVTEEALDWVTSQPLALIALSTIIEFVDDIHDYMETKHSTAVECYMNQYGVSYEEAIDELLKQVSDAWKDLNYECFVSGEMPLPIMERIFNLAIMMPAFYHHGGDGYAYSGTHTKQLIKSLLVDPIA